ncbi:MAG: biotin transporter BioY, partial [Acidobacteriia bacterium]|nr:biotin transporter BioY [Methyloceanibacter sp.]MCL6492769.1 biotin transporter BioY [Terriglobia bacterium]
SVFAYLLAGFAGLPVFAGGGGPLYFVGPTAGYLVGFLPAAAIVGFGARRGVTRRLPSAFLLMLGADMVVFACGLSWLSFLIGPRAALTHGLLPFLPAEAVKIALATALSRLVVKRAG